MTRERWDRIQALFHEAIDLPSNDRSGFLRGRCDDDDDLHRRVCELLEEDARGDSLLDRGVGYVAALGEAWSPIDAGRSFGPYRIRHKLGEGGMGVVYLADRADLGTVVAIKFLRDAWLVPSRRERFASERRTLGRLNHPSIARLYDADTLEDGTPWFVMEYVEGLPITEHCARNAVTLGERLRLFRLVCEAVRYAHGMAVIHRDLKPSNILVKSDGSVRLLDFGIAKHLEGFDGSPERTMPGERLLTPAYAAPEHILGSAARVQSDVYSLGVILYELVTGRRPFDGAHADPRAVARAILDGDVEKPSVAAREPEIAGRAAWADLDALCLMAMHGDVARRYASAEALIRDVDRFVAGEPLEARPDALGYRVGKFASRHRRELVVATAALVSAGALVSAFAVRLANARGVALAEAGRTARAQRFMLDLFDGGERAVGPPDELRVVELIDRGAREAGALAFDPDLQSELFATLGTMYRKLGRLDRAEDLLLRALDIRREAGGDAHRDVGETFVALAFVRADQARYDEAERYARDGLALLARDLPRNHPAVAKAVFAVGRVLEDRGDYAAAIRYFEDAAARQSQGAGGSPDLPVTLSELANANFYLGRYERSDALNRRVLDMHRTTYGDGHALIADALFNVAAVHFERGDYLEAERCQREALAITETWYGADHPAIASAQTLLAQSLAYRRLFDEAEPLLASALAIATAAFGDGHPRVASVLQRLGKVALERGRLDEAEAYFTRTAAVQAGAHAQNHQTIANALSNLGSVFLERGDDARAAEVLRDAVERYARALSGEHVYTGIARIKLGRALLRARRPRESLVETRAGYDVVRRGDAADPKWLEMASADIAAATSALVEAPPSADDR